MSQTAFGLIMLGCLLALSTGMTVLADWPDIKRWCIKHGLFRAH